MNNKPIEQEQKILNSLNDFTGSGNFYKDYLGCLLTDGFKELCEVAGCYWLFSDVASVLMTSNKLKQEPFILCKIIKHKDKSCGVMLFRDYRKDDLNFNRENLLYIQHYEYTDLPLKDYEFYICLNELNTFTFLLKGEY